MSNKPLESRDSYKKGYMAALEKKYGIGIRRIIKATITLERQRIEEEVQKVPVRVQVSDRLLPTDKQHLLLIDRNSVLETINKQE